MKALYKKMKRTLTSPKMFTEFCPFISFNYFMETGPLYYFYTNADIFKSLIHILSIASQWPENKSLYLYPLFMREWRGEERGVGDIYFCFKNNFLVLF